MRPIGWLALCCVVFFGLLYAVLDLPGFVFALTLLAIAAMVVAVALCKIGAESDRQIDEILSKREEAAKKLIDLAGKK